jgi:hypothetical protein
VLGGHPLLAAAGPGLLATTIQFLENVLHADALMKKEMGLKRGGTLKWPSSRNEP